MYTDNPEIAVMPASVTTYGCYVQLMIPCTADLIATAPMGDRNKPRELLPKVKGTALRFNSVFMVQCTQMCTEA